MFCAYFREKRKFSQSSSLCFRELFNLLCTFRTADEIRIVVLFIGHMTLCEKVFISFSVGIVFEIIIYLHRVNECSTNCGIWFFNFQVVPCFFIVIVLRLLLAPFIVPSFNIVILFYQLRHYLELKIHMCIWTVLIIPL